MKEIGISTEYIALGQFLKLSDCIDSGGAAKFFLQENEVLINGEPDDRRGRKLYTGDKIDVKGFGSFTIVKR
ncbi:MULTISPECIES: S4 domain-containing protein YaaA [Paenibacillus]|uniref:S4 domain-containing protein YaaA n=1 Tax=Paenibacillus lignilyticus TaxID=1172615 RepID=A0ABS5CM35_9BACL|nr:MULTISPECIES: S4 domain-containing protein YaaA [Paenibacillus]MBP3966896.1 S4 domain-containing protein YaaA [Paenibacillus lignilyticus]SDX00653.1 S4 domain protein YaaA [Paenibacillus sp. CF384]SFT23415.1 S4 domain protein YaaA [Paenibacillus sp. BC26]